MSEQQNHETTGQEAACAPAGARAALPHACKVKAQPKRGNSQARMVREVQHGKPPTCAKSDGGLFWESHFVPVSFVAKDWNVTPRRIRSLLTAQRLEGRRQANGYWEVAYPYHFIIGTRGPVLKRQRTFKRGRPKAELRAV